MTHRGYSLSRTRSSTLNVSFRNLYSFYPVPDGGFLIGGQGEGFKWKVAKVDGQGATQWERIYEFPNYSWGYPRDIEAYEDGFLIVGSLARINPYGFCPIMVKVGADGSPQWLKLVSNCDTNNALDAFAIHPEYNLIYVAGRKYCAPGSINLDAYVDITDDSPTVILSDRETVEAAAFELFPNPAKGKAHVILPEGSSPDSWQLSLFTAAGQLALRRQESGSRFTLDTGALPPGLYLLRVTDGQRAFSRRLVVE